MQFLVYPKEKLEWVIIDDGEDPIEDLLPKDDKRINYIKLPKKISFLHLDMNTHIGEIAALKVLFPRLAKGGVCLLDDFGMSLAKEQMLEEKKWFSKINYNICELPTGQAFVIKH